MANNISLSDILHNRPAVVPTIYGYVLPTVADHNGYIKSDIPTVKIPKTELKSNYIPQVFRLRCYSKSLQCVPTELALQIKMFIDC